MNRFMQSQVNSALLALRALDQSIEMAAQEDDGVISKEERKQIKKIRKAVKKFSQTMARLK